MPLRNTVTILIVAVISLVCYEKAERNRFPSMISLAMGLIEAHYIEEVEPRTLFENAMQGMVRGLDPYSAYIGPEHFQQFKQSIDQEFVGIGVHVEGPPLADQLRVVSPLYDSPAFRAGMRAGDLILEIDGVPAKTMDVEEAVKRMKGPEGSRVTLLIQHPDADAQPLRLDITRQWIQTKSVLGDHLLPDGRWNYFLDAEPRIGYVRITTFGEFTVRELREVLQFADHPIDALILDLRGNEGGLLDKAVHTCDLFLDEGVIVSTRGRHAADEVVYEADPTTTIFPQTIPMVVLVDQRSASASEIVAACLQDHGRAAVAGQRTFGKGTVQNVIPFEHNTSALKLTTASYWRPNGQNIHRAEGATDEDTWGVTPEADLTVELTDEQYLTLVRQRSARDVLSTEDTAHSPSLTLVPDPQLDRVVEYLKEKRGALREGSGRSSGAD